MHCGVQILANFDNEQGVFVRTGSVCEQSAAAVQTMAKPNRQQQ